jgi:hypothetical protein
MHDAGIVTHDGAADAPWQPPADAGNPSVHGGQDATPGQIPPPDVKTPATDQPAGPGGETDATNHGEDDRGDRKNDNDKNGYSADDLFSVSFTRPSAPCGRRP